MSTPDKPVTDINTGSKDNKSEMPSPPKPESYSQKNVPAAPKSTELSKFQRIPVENFPDTIVTQYKTIVQATIPNLRFMFCSYGIIVEYCVITKRTLTSIPGLHSNPTNADNAAYAHIVSLAKLNGMSTDSLAGYLLAIADENQRNPVMEWITSKPWDGVDRLPEFYNTLTVREDFPIALRNLLIFRWLISAVAAASMAIGFRSRGVLTLQGEQSLGKTSWVLALVSDAMLRDMVVLIDHLLDAKNKDSILKAIAHWIVELGELDSSFKSDIARIKGFLTAMTDKVRAPYAKVASEHPRKTVFCATVNDEQFLVDPTGNTRFWTVPVVAVNHEHGINMQQLWAQVGHLYHVEGEKWWLTPSEEQLLESFNRQHRSVSAIRELIESELDFDAPDDKWMLKSSSDVLRYLGIERPTNAQARECGHVLREKIGPPTRSQGSNRWRIPPSHSWTSEYSQPRTIGRTHVQVTELPKVPVPPIVPTK